MNRTEFIEELIDYFEDFTPENTPKRVKAYELVLSDSIDYDQLYMLMLKNYKSFKYAPTPADLLQILKNRYQSFY